MAPRSSAAWRCRRAGSMLPFTVLDAAGRVVGMTTYMNIDAAHRRVEIGSHLVSPQRVQRSAAQHRVQAAAARPCLRDAGLHRGRVPHAPPQHAEPARDRAPGRAARRHPARHQRAADGTLRDTAVYSITARRMARRCGRTCDWQLDRAALSSAPDAMAQEEDSTVDDLWQIERARPPSLSPDGAQAVCSLTRYSMDDNTASSALWLLSTLGGAAAPADAVRRQGRPAALVARAATSSPSSPSANSRAARTTSRSST